MILDDFKSVLTTGRVDDRSFPAVRINVDVRASSIARFVGFLFDSRSIVLRIGRSEFAVSLNKYRFSVKMVGARVGLAVVVGKQ